MVSRPSVGTKPTCAETHTLHTLHIVVLKLKCGRPAHVCACVRAIFSAKSRNAREPQVLAQLKRCPAEDTSGAAGLEADLLCRLLKENPVLKRIEVSCRPRLAGSVSLKRYGAGEVYVVCRESRASCGRAWIEGGGRLRAKSCCSAMQLCIGKTGGRPSFRNNAYFLLAVGLTCCVARARRFFSVAVLVWGQNRLCLGGKAGRHRGRGLWRQPLHRPGGSPRVRCSGDALETRVPKVGVELRCIRACLSVLGTPGTMLLLYSAHSWDTRHYARTILGTVPL